MDGFYSGFLQWDRYSGALNFNSTKHVLLVRASFSFDKLRTSSVRRAFDITHVMVSVFRSVQKLSTDTPEGPFGTNPNGPKVLPKSFSVFQRFEGISTFRICDPSLCVLAAYFLKVYVLINSSSV